MRSHACAQKRPAAPAARTALAHALARSPDGRLSREEYMALGRKRAPNFTDELRGNVVWPIFDK